MNKILSTILVLTLFASGGTAFAFQEQTGSSSQPSNNILEPLTHLDYKNPWDIVTDGRYIYVDSLIDPGGEVIILDMIDPAHIAEIASIPVESPFQLLAIANNTLYLGPDPYTPSGYAGIQIYDVSDPYNPERIGSFEQPGSMHPTQMVIVGDLAYVADAVLGLLILDISDPAHPSLLGKDSEEVIFGLAVEGQYAYGIQDAFDYVAYGKLMTYDISNPAQPVLLGRYENTLRVGSEIAVSGSIAYFWGFINDGPEGMTEYFMDVIDISDPSNPERVAEVPELAIPVRELLVKNELLYAVRSGGLGFYSLAEPLNPQLSSIFPSYWGADVELLDSQALFLDTNTGLHVLDINDPAHPIQIGSYTWPGDAGYLASVGIHLFTVQSDVAYPLNYHEYPNVEWKSLLKVIDSSDPFNARVIGWIVLDGNTLGKPYVDESFIYLPTEPGMAIVDISDPTDVHLVSLAGAINSSVVEVLDSVAYSYSKDVGSGATLSIIGVRNPLSPTLLSQTTAYFNTEDMSIAKQGDRIFAYLISDSQLIILDVTDPPNLFEVRRELLEVSDTVIDTENRGSQTIAYYTSIMNYHYGTMAMDVSDPEHPIFLSFVEIVGVFEAKDEIVYFLRENGLVLYDFTDPAHPHQVVTYQDPDWTGYFSVQDASMEGEYIYTTNGWGDITVYAKASKLNGYVTDHNYKPFSGVTLSLNTGEQTVTTEDGSYLYSDLDFDQYIITPTLGSFDFIPPYREVNLPADLEPQNFIILPPPTSAILEPGITTTLTYTDVQGLPTSFVFPSGLVSSMAIAHITPTLASSFFGKDFAGHAFHLAINTEGPDLPTDLFSPPVSVTIQYSLEDTAVVTDTTNLTLYRYNGSGWEAGDASCPPTSEPPLQEPGIFQGRLCQEGLYALLGPSHGIALPLISFGGENAACEPPGCPPMSTNLQE